ncbi:MULTISPECIES: hypothetical protein [Rhizobium]|uniref:hypothetical protein n=1 Tax=Rhizobium TaxID=379 RepID=UPI001A933761|nr:MULTISPECIES: hypothetical protein [Rhizobium]MBX4872701.1 hypothetical protein [Rhizobium bangladeshense]MBX5063316.1 hypothetical protein [Rhizobium lentis]MBX5075421.1 hypothetical protein [Rhizobium lentis]QSW93072.1 hypothetical protein J0663_18690 [Rhizobium lentis]
MPKFDYERFAGLAQRLISKFGQTGIIKRITPPDPVLGGDSTSVDYPVKLVPMTYDQRYVDGTNVRASDRQLYISSVGLAIKPTVGDEAVTADGVAYHIIAVDPHNYDGITDVVFIVQGRTNP